VSGRSHPIGSAVGKWIAGVLAAVVAGVATYYVVDALSGPPTAEGSTQPTHNAPPSPPISDHSTRPAASPTMTSANSDASITSPRNGAFLRGLIVATGHIGHIATGHQLLLFLYVPAADRYFLGDDITIKPDGSWSGKIFIGGRGYVGEPLQLWLADLGPQALKILDVYWKHETNPSNPEGLVSLRFAPDATALTKIDLVGS
jgi:hypothetical protein